MSLHKIIVERNELEKFDFDPLVHTKDGKTWLERNQVKNHSLHTSILLLEALKEKCEKEIDEATKKSSETMSDTYIGKIAAFSDLKDWIESEILKIKEMK